MYVHNIYRRQIRRVALLLLSIFGSNNSADSPSRYRKYAQDVKLPLFHKSTLRLLNCQSIQSLFHFFWLDSPLSEDYRGSHSRCYRYRNLGIQRPWCWVQSDCWAPEDRRVTAWLELIGLSRPTDWEFGRTYWGSTRLSLSAQEYNTTNGHKLGYFKQSIVVKCCQWIDWSIVTSD